MGDINPDLMEVNEVKKQKARNFPMPKKINYYMLKNYGYEFYGAKVYSDKVRILHEIKYNLNMHGYNFSESEIERRLKNMKSHYRRKNEDIEMGIIQKTDWEYYDLLHSIFSRIIQDKEIRMPKFLISTEMQQSSSGIDIPEVPITNCEKIKQEEQEPTNMESDEIDEPLDMSIKNLKVIEFNNIKEVKNQIPIPPPPENYNEEKRVAINRVIENLKVVDQARLALDEQRLKLEIKRNELDRLGYQLNTLLSAFLNQ